MNHSRCKCPHTPLPKEKGAQTASQPGFRRCRYYQASLSSSFQAIGDIFTGLTAAVGAADKVCELSFGGNITLDRNCNSLTACLAVLDNPVPPPSTPSSLSNSRDPDP
jgi:hypothetical protein